MSEHSDSVTGKERIGPELVVSPPRRLCIHRGSSYDLWGNARIGWLLLASAVGCILGGIWLMRREATPTIGLALIVFGALTLLLALVVNYQTIHCMVRDASLVKYGSVTYGEIISHEVKQVEDSMGAYHVVGYKFHTTAGQEIVGIWNPADKPFWHYRVGDKLVVVYDQKRPKRHIDYAASLFQAASALNVQHHNSVA